MPKTRLRLFRFHLDTSKSYYSQEHYSNSPSFSGPPLPPLLSTHRMHCNHMCVSCGTVGAFLVVLSFVLSDGSGTAFKKKSQRKLVPALTLHCSGNFFALYTAAYIHVLTLQCIFVTPSVPLGLRTL